MGYHEWRYFTGQLTDVIDICAVGVLLSPVINDQGDHINDQGDHSP